MAAIGLALSGVAELPQIINGVVGLVHGFEHLFGKGNGAAKKAAVISALQGGVSAYDGVAATLAGTKIGSKIPQVNEPLFESAVGNFIDAIVSFSNATGMFTHSVAPVAPAAPAVSQ